MKRNIAEGIIEGNERGYAFFLPDDADLKDYFISHSDLRGALHGDRVLAELDNRGERTTARVLKIISRGVAEVVGTYFSCKSGGFVVPDDKKFFCDVFVPFGKGERVKSGDKVVCKILSYPKHQNPEGLVSKVLGRQFEKNAELNAVYYNYKLPNKFPSDVLTEAKLLSGEITEDDIKGREDFRNSFAVTIDGQDAKDFDDAVSVEKLPDGKFLLCVHIADVSHYVKQGSKIDKEAFNRGTSVYFPERVVPMLPERLCNDLCSLKQGVDRLTLSCIMTVNTRGEVENSRITPSIIKSSARLTYDAVQGVLDGNAELIKQYNNILQNILLMDELADVLIDKRTKDGSIDLDVKESKITVLKGGEIKVESATQTKSQRIIEEFMVLANACVAEYMFYVQKPFVYRVHEKPAPEKVEAFYNFLKCIGINAKRRRGEVFSKDFQLILKNAENTPQFTVINRVMLRSMQKAVYSPEEKGHFGLSLKFYSHFTSPIRRYPDLLIHRIIKMFLAGEEIDEEKYQNIVSEASEQASKTERKAVEAERAVDDFYKVLYIDNYVGEEFDAVISGVTNFALFAELDNGIEGIIKLSTIKGGRFNYDKGNYALSNGKTTYKLGQKVKIKVAGVSLTERRAEFMLVQE